MQVGVFGSARVVRSLSSGDEPERLDVGARKPRSVIAALALHPGQPVPADRLADLVWAGEPPRAAHGALHAYISGLRKVLEPGRAARTAASVLETTDHGYVLRVAPEDVDAHRFVSDVRRVERALAPLVSQLTPGQVNGWPDRPTVATALDELDAALATWTGQPYADLLEHPDVVAERGSLEQVRAAAEQTRLLGLLALGEHASVLSTTEARIATNPLQERWWSLHALALTRAGRQADALDSLRAVRDLLADELGLDPGPELRELEQGILRQDPGLLRTLDDSPTAPRERTPTLTPPVPRTPAAPIGRAAERSRLHGLLDATAAGTATAGLLVGEPGIGKTWLLTDVAREAERRGFVVARGACSQDDGAPPLWPWLGVLRAIDADGDAGLASVTDLSTDGESPARQAFETSDRIAGTLLEAAEQTPVLVVLDDLQWADDATLRTVRHLLAVTPSDAALAIVASRRAHPEPEGALAEVGEAFARRHSLRLDLTGLDLADARELVRSVAGADVPDATAVEWHDRSEGNPFFLVELARLAEPDAAHVPTTVRDVVTRRLAGLNGPTLDTLRLAAAAGRRFHARTVASAAGRDLDHVLDDLEAARTAGLVLEADAGDFAFVHAITRDAVHQAVAPTRRARLHAQVAHALESDSDLRRLFAEDELTAELARHWLAAGPSHLDSAWRAARAAADQARSLSAYGEAARLRTAAVSAHRTAPGAAEEDRFDLLLELARDAAYAANWYAVVDAAFEAMMLGRALGSPERVGRAAAALTYYCVWTPHDWEEVYEDVVDDLRWALATLPERDSPARCMLLLSLAVELYYEEGAVAERGALVTSGLALARRLGDPLLLWWATRAAFLASWSPSHTEERIAWAEEGLRAARDGGDVAAEAVSLLALATDHLELGRMDLWKEFSARAEEIARRERLPYVLFTLTWLEVNLASIRGDDEERERRLAELSELAGQVALPSGDIQGPAMLVVSHMWEPSIAGFTDLILQIAEVAPLARATCHALLARAARPDLLMKVLVEHPYTERVESWQTSLSYCYEAEAASAVGDVALARKAAEILEPFAGRMAVAGIAVAIGPVDGYLALAAATYGDTEAASRYADRALELAEEWRLPVYRDWLLAHRARLGI